MGTLNASTTRRLAGGVVVLLLLIAGAALLLPTGARAGYIESRFTAPPPPDPAWESAGDPQVSQDHVAYKVGGDDDFRSGYVWQMGDPTAVAWPQFAYCTSFDYANWDADDVIVYCRRSEDAPDEVRVTNGVLDFQLNLGDGAARNPRIDGVIVVWQEMADGQWDIMSAELDSETLAVTERTAVCAAAGDQTRPDVAGGVVVWQDHRRGQWDIYGRNLNLGGEKRICGDPASQTHPSIDSHWVAWEDRRNHGFGADIYARNAYCYTASNKWKIGPVRAVCHARGDQLQPATGWGYIVWSDWRNADDHLPDYPPNTEIRGYRIPSKKSFRITTSTAMQIDPDIDYRTVVYTELSGTHMGAPANGIVKGARLQP